LSLRPAENTAFLPKAASSIRSIRNASFNLDPTAMVLLGYGRNVGYQTVAVKPSPLAPG
jgi:hypothetical protein